MLARVVAFVLCAVLGTVPLCAQAAGSIISFTQLTAGGINYTVNGLTNNRLSGSQTIDFSLHIHTTALAGSVTLGAPPVTGTGGNSITKGAWWASCTVVSDPGGLFTSSGIVQLGAGNVTCATIASTSNNTVQFAVSLFLDETPDVTSFTSDTYSSGLLGVTANAP